MNSERLARMHPRQAAVLVEIPEEDREAVFSSAMLMQNLVGGNLSGCLYSAAAQYRRVGLEAMKRQDRLSCARAMRWEVDEDGHRIDR
jgi:hypothetical protein